MFSILTTSGQNQIALADSGSLKITITGFKVGDLHVSVPDLKVKDTPYTFSDHPELLDKTWIEANFISKYDGDASHIKYTLIALDTVLLKFFLPQDIPLFMFNCVLIYATINGVQALFSLHYALNYNPKFSTVTNRTGTKYYYLLQLKVATRDDRMSFANLTLEAAEFDAVSSLFDLPFAPKMLHDQFILETHELTNAPGPFLVFNSEDQFFAAPLELIDINEDRNIKLAPSGNYYSHNEADDVPDGFELLLNDDDAPRLDRFGNQIIVRTE